MTATSDQSDVEDLINAARLIASQAVPRRPVPAVTGGRVPSVDRLVQGQLANRRDPLEQHLRDQIRTIGDRLHGKGGTAAMSAVLERVLEEEGAAAAELIDKLWAEIGGWATRPSGD